MSDAVTDERPARLIAMANQIGQFCKPYPEAGQISGIREHIEKFWDVKMRRTILAYLAQGGEGLDATVRQALEGLAAPDRN